MNQEKLNEILKSHEEWVKSKGKNGSRAELSDEDLCGADLRYAILRDIDFQGARLCKADLRGADLSSANLREVNFYEADLRGADLRGTFLYGARLCKADLRGADLSSANLCVANIRETSICGANLCKADLRGALLPKGIYVAGGAGSRQRYTYYDAVNDCVICGCWSDDAGNHLDGFKKRIEDVYGKNGKTPNQKHYKEYQAAIYYFEACRDAYKMEP